MAASFITHKAFLTSLTLLAQHAYKHVFSAYYVKVLICIIYLHGAYIR